MVDVFISHASEDKVHWARPLAELLTERGLTVWLDESELQVGARLEPRLVEAIERCRRVLVLVSPHYVVKEWTLKELQLALKREESGEDVLIPVWHNMDERSLNAHPDRLVRMLADRVAARTLNGVASIASRVYAVLDVAHGPGLDEKDHFATLTQIQAELSQRPPDVYLVEYMGRTVTPTPFVRIDGNLLPREPMHAPLLFSSLDGVRKHLIEEEGFPVSRIEVRVPFLWEADRRFPIDSNAVTNLEHYGQPLAVLPPDARIFIYEDGSARSYAHRIRG